jgi:hypothetical protein
LALHQYTSPRNFDKSSLAKIAVDDLVFGSIIGIFD